MNKKQRDQNRDNARGLKRKFGPVRECPNCKSDIRFEGGHYVPAGMGDKAGFTCAAVLHA